MKEKEYKSTGGVYEDGYQRSCTPTTTNMSKNEFFEKNGYLFVPGLIGDPENLFDPPPVDENGKRITGQMNYIRKDKVTFIPTEHQVNGSLARYNVPIYKELHYLVRKQIEKRLGMELLPTYFYDRFYSPGQILKRHSDRPACEVSVTLQISTTLKNPWPIWFERPDGSESYVLMNNGDAAVYKGCEREHWRDAMPDEVPWWKKKVAKIRGKEIGQHHHQLFLHYVDANGPFVHYAFDAVRP